MHTDTRLLHLPDEMLALILRLAQRPARQAAAGTCHRLYGIVHELATTCHAVINAEVMLPVVHCPTDAIDTQTAAIAARAFRLQRKRQYGAFVPQLLQPHHIVRLICQRPALKRLCITNRTHVHPQLPPPSLPPVQAATLHAHQHLEQLWLRAECAWRPLYTTLVQHTASLRTLRLSNASLATVDALLDVLATTATQLEVLDLEHTADDPRRKNDQRVVSAVQPRLRAVRLLNCMKAISFPWATATPCLEIIVVRNRLQWINRVHCALPPTMRVIDLQYDTKLLMPSVVSCAATTLDVLAYPCIGTDCTMEMPNLRAVAWLDTGFQFFAWRAQPPQWQNTIREMHMPAFPLGSDTAVLAGVHTLVIKARRSDRLPHNPHWAPLITRLCPGLQHFRWIYKGWLYTCRDLYPGLRALCDVVPTVEVVCSKPEVLQFLRDKLPATAVLTPQAPKRAPKSGRHWPYATDFPVV